MQQSPHWRDGVFHNRATTRPPQVRDQRHVLGRWLAARPGYHPPVDVPLLRDVVVSSTGDPAEPALTGLQLTWFGHASALVELDGVRLLLDPVWSDRCSPSPWIGPRRLHPVPCTLDELGRIDAVVISHDHYDHLDLATIKHLAASSAALFVVPLGIGAHLERWGVPEARIVELDWDEHHEVGPVRLTCVESQHFSGRWLTRDDTLWASWVITGASGRVFFSGDTGYFPGYPQLLAAYGPFDVALMAVGAYDPAWSDIHLNPEEAVQATVDLGSPLLVPIHWGTFTLGPHTWAAPIDRMLVAAEAHGVRTFVPRPGERITIGAPPTQSAWWRRA